jgi:hypothetical protein
MREISMTRFTRLLTAAAVIGAIAVPAAAQAPYPYPYPPQQQPLPPYPQPAPGQPGYGYYPPEPGYGQPGYGYQQGYGNIDQMLNPLLGNRYSPADRTAIRQCASAAIAQASAQYRPQNVYGQPPYGQPPYGYSQGYGYNQGYGYQQGYNPAARMRVTAITNVERRQDGLRVSGLLDSRGGYPPYGQAYGYQNNGYAAVGDLSFRCNVDYRGAVTNLRVRRANQYRG